MLKQDIGCVYIGMYIVQAGNLKYAYVIPDVGNVSRGTVMLTREANMRRQCTVPLDDHHVKPNVNAP